MRCERADATVDGNPLLVEALRLARLGYAVFPCRSGRKSQPPHTACWTQLQTKRPSETGGRVGRDANLALATGRGLVVIDVDAWRGPGHREASAKAYANCGHR
jgi:hypothetical protein